MPRYRKSFRSADIEYLELRLLFTSIPLPVIPTGAGHLFVVTSSPYNAVGDGSTDDTAAIQAAINACNAAGGGTVEIPVVTGAKNIYEFTQLTLGSNTNFQIDAGAELQVEPLGVEPGGVVCIEASQVSNLEITGGGDIDGNGGSGSTAPRPTAPAPTPPAMAAQAEISCSVSTCCQVTSTNPAASPFRTSSTS